MRRERDDVLFALGVALWVAIIALTWPRALSFGDEVGYVGRAKLLLEGHLGYVPNSPGVWIPTPKGPVSQYQVAFSALLAPLFAMAPRSVFALSVASAVAIAVIARAVLKSWGKSPLWGLVILAHPSIIILARSAMVDVVQAAVVVGAWWALRRCRAAAVAWLLLLVVLKPTGVVLLFGVIAAEVISSFGALRARDAAARCRIKLAAGAGGLALLGLALTNYIGSGTVHFAYQHTMISTPPFWYSYLPLRAPVHLATVLLDPPLLIVGAWAFWRRRERGVALLSVGFLALMCAYFFVDYGANRLESMALSPRLILPSVALLLIGYGAALDDLARRLLGARACDDAGRLHPAIAALLIVVPLVAAGTISMKHRQNQRDESHVLDATVALADARGGALGVTPNACKAGLLYHGTVTLYDPLMNRPPVVFCSEVSASHRFDDGRTSCALTGYRAVTSRGGFFALVRDGASTKP